MRGDETRKRRLRICAAALAFATVGWGCSSSRHSSSGAPTSSVPAVSDRTTTTKPKPRAKPRPTTTTRATTPTTAQQVVTKAPEEATLPAPPPPPPPPPTSPPTTVRGNCPKKGALTTINGGTWICEPQGDGSLFWTPPPPSPPGTAVAQCPATPPRPDDAGCCNDGVTVAVPPVMLGQEQPTLDELCKAHGGAHVHYNGYP